MDLKIYSTEDLLLAGLKAEMDSKELYTDLVQCTENAFLKERLSFLAAEEEKHRGMLERLYRKTAGKDPVVPKEAPVPMPGIGPEDMKRPLPEIFRMAMEAEKAAHDFYEGLAGRFMEDSDIRSTLTYMAIMEMGHYKLLDLERDSLERMEDLSITWDMMHAGP